MIDPNLTAMANMTETFDQTPMIISGTINGTQPVLMEVSGNVSAVVSQPGFNFLIGLEIVQSFCLVLVTMAVLAGLYLDVTRKRGV